MSRDMPLTARNVSVIYFLQLSIQFTANFDLAQRNGFYYPTRLLMLNLILHTTNTSGRVHFNYKKINT